jgi:hypothetical protein
MRPVIPALLTSFLRHVAVNGQRLAAGGLDVGDDRARLGFAIAVVDGHAGTFPRGKAGNGRADAPAGAGDDHNAREMLHGRLFGFVEPGFHEVGERVERFFGLGAFGFDEDHGAGACRKHHQPHDGGAVHALPVLGDGHLGVEFLDAFDEGGRCAGVKPLAVQNLNFSQALVYARSGHTAHSCGLGECCSVIWPRREYAPEPRQGEEKFSCQAEKELAGVIAVFENLATIFLTWIFEWFQTAIHLVVKT